MSPPASRKRVTIRDVARFARVSHQTVSRFINGENHIAPPTRTRVEQAIARLRFHPSHIARSLVSRQTKTVGLVMGDVASPFFPDVARGAEDDLAAAGYSLILSSSRRDPERERRNVKHLLERSTDGLILGAPQCAPEELAEMARRADIPMVFLNREVKGPRVAAVWIDWPTATTEVVTYLTDLGHRRLALVVPSRSDARVGNREDWYRPALTRAGLGPERALDLPGRDVARGRSRRRPAPPGDGAPADGRHLPQRRDGDRSPAGVRRAGAARARGSVHRRMGRRAVREPRHAPAHHREGAPVRARPGRGAEAARPDGGPPGWRRRAAAGPRARPAPELRPAGRRHVPSA